jgi:predicted solute-binding protein
MLHGPQRGLAELSFELPAACAARLEEGSADIGLVPVGALLERPMSIYKGTGIACRGPVRSILLVSKVAAPDIRSLALDSSSRTSVLLARIILARRWGVEPELKTMAPSLGEMLAACDACLIIGDPALALNPAELVRSGLHVLDLGAEWLAMTGLPMVFAVWAGRPNMIGAEVLIDSWQFGMDHLADIIRLEAPRRGLSPELAREYLTEHIAFDLGRREYEGMELYLRCAAEVLEPASLNTAS